VPNERRLPYRIGRNVSSVAKIDASSDLVEWLPAGSVILDATGAGSFEEAATEGPRFYRIAIDPEAPN